MKPRAIYAVEISGICNFESKCSWCPMHRRPRNRQRGLMEERTIHRSLYWVEKLAKVDALALHLFGEPFLHPRFAEYAALFAKVAPITVSTNGALLTEKLADALAKIPWAWISISPWDKASIKKARKLLTERGIETKDPPGVTHNWAGQTKNEATAKIKGCPFLTEAKPSIRWDGTLASCCITDRPEDSLGDIFGDELPLMRPYTLCETCHHAR